MVLPKPQGTSAFYDAVAHALCTEGQSESVDTALLHTHTKGSDGAASEGCG